MARGHRNPQVSMLAFIDLETRVPEHHPIRAVKRIADRLLADLSSLFDTMYAADGRPSVPPERLLKASLLMALFSVRSERAFCETLDYHLLYRWFLDMDLLEPSFDASTFTKNRGRLLEHEVAHRFFAAVVQEANRLALLSDEHFTIDGTLIRADASLKSFRATDAAATPPSDDPGNPSVDFKGEQRSNATHTSTTDPEARLMRKGNHQAAELYYTGHALMENRNGLLVGFEVTQSTGTAERDVVVPMLADARTRGFHPTTLGADKGYDVAATVSAVRELEVDPHFARITYREQSTIPAAKVTEAGYQISQRKRKRIEEIFGWGKTIGGLRRTRVRGLARTKMAMLMTAAAYNLMRMARIEVGISTANPA